MSNAYLTSYQHDFKYHRLDPQPCPKSKFEIPSGEKQPKSYLAKDISTAQPFRLTETVDIPFDIFWTPKEIVGTVPFHDRPTLVSTAYTGPWSIKGAEY